MGIEHPDDMSHIILHCYHREANNKDWDLEGEIETIRNFWKRQKENNKS